MFDRIRIRSLLADLPLKSEEETPTAAPVVVEQHEAMSEQGVAIELPSTASQNEAVGVVVEEESAMAVEMTVE